ncbi:hypothetical protein, partial [Burkholderia sp. Tr-20355]|uniref:hypothetical protein n=1 Tax=Burkholderia sp. Tr-20355 TaxID=2703895 RepID=UPI00197CF44C
MREKVGGCKGREAAAKRGVKMRRKVDITSGARKERKPGRQDEQYNWRVSQYRDGKCFFFS